MPPIPHLAALATSSAHDSNKITRLNLGHPVLPQHAITKYRDAPLLNSLLYRWNRDVRNFAAKPWMPVADRDEFKHLGKGLKDLGFTVDEALMSGAAAEERLVSYETVLPKPFFLSFLPDFGVMPVTKKQYIVTDLQGADTADRIILYEHSVVRDVPMISTITARTTTIIGTDGIATCSTDVSYHDTNWMIEILSPRIDAHIFDSIRSLWTMHMQDVCGNS